MTTTSIVIRTICLSEEQNYSLEGWKWNYKMNCSKIVRKILNYYMKNPDKLKEILNQGNKNGKKTIKK